MPFALPYSLLPSTVVKSGKVETEISRWPLMFAYSADTASWSIGNRCPKVANRAGSFGANELGKPFTSV